jgi:pimeloyl-ACP methyl ester carboxylesterase
MTAILTKAVVEAPNIRTTPDVLKPKNHDILVRDDETYALAWGVPVGPPQAILSAAVIAPGDYGYSMTISQRPLADGRVTLKPISNWTIPTNRPDPRTPAKATILILHGYEDSKEGMLHWAFFLAKLGYRSILVDLRGHGRSTGNWIGYGAFEVRDLEQVLDDAEKRGLATGPIGVLGSSYGASIALELAGKDPRIASVVALEPFSDARNGVVEFAHGVIPGMVKSWTDEDFSNALDRAAKMAHFSWSNTDILSAVERTNAPILYIRGKNDRWIPPTESDILDAHTRPPHLTFTATLPWGNDHVILSWLLDPIAGPVSIWFDETLLNPGPDLLARVMMRTNRLPPITAPSITEP